MNGSVAPLIVNFDTGRRWVVSFTLGPLYTQLAGPQVWSGRFGSGNNLLSIPAIELLFSVV